MRGGCERWLWELVVRADAEVVVEVVVGGGAEMCYKSYDSWLWWEVLVEKGGGVGEVVVIGGGENLWEVVRAW